MNKDQKIKVNLNDLKELAKAEKQKEKLENNGYVLAYTKRLGMDLFEFTYTKIR